MAGSSTHEALTEAELGRIDLAEARSYEALFAAAGPALGTGSRWLDGVLVIWHPREPEAGYSYLVNFHNAPDLDRSYAEGLEILQATGAPVIGVPVDERIGAWASPEKLAVLGLGYESDEVIWARRLAAREAVELPTLGPEIALDEPPPAEPELAALINRCWDLDPDHSRGTLYASALRLPGWLVIAPRVDGRVAGVTMASYHEGVACLMLAMVLPEFRGRGLQTWFIARRLAEGVARGCTLAMSETNDDNASPRNLQRAGFVRSIVRRVYSRPLG